MQGTLITLIAVAVVAMIGVNVYFRARVLRAYRQLSRAGVEFDARDMLTEARVRDLIRQFPSHEVAIRQFTGGIRNSMTIATALIAAITLLGAVLMWYR